jgi:hypothetical protein
MIITVLAALAAPCLAEESAAFGTQAQDAVAAASAVEKGKEAATEKAREENEDGEDDGVEAALVEEDEEGEEDDGEEDDEDEDPSEEAAEKFVSEGDTIPPSTNLMRTRKSPAKAAMQIDSSGAASSKKGKESATPDIAKHQQGDDWEPVGLMQKRRTGKGFFGKKKAETVTARNRDSIHRRRLDYMS